MTKKHLAHLALFIVALIYGSNYSIAKIAMNAPTVSPMGMIFLRILSGAILFSIIYGLFIRERIKTRDIPLFILCGLTGAALNMSMFFIGLDKTTPIHASLVMTISPVMVVIFSIFIIKEKISKYNLLGIALALAGAIFLIYKPDIQTGKSTIVGDLFVFLNASSYALYLVLIKNLISRYHPFTILMMVFSIGFLMVLPFSYSNFRAIGWTTMETPVITSVLFVIICTTFLSYLLNAVALTHVKSSTAGSYIYLQPVIATIIAILLGQDRFEFKIAISAVLIFTGLFLVSRKNVKI